MARLHGHNLACFSGANTGSTERPVIEQARGSARRCSQPVGAEALGAVGRLGRAQSPVGIDRQAACGGRPGDAVPACGDLANDGTVTRF